MEFYKDTIIGQVIHDVQRNEHNELYFTQIDELVEDIIERYYNCASSIPWQSTDLYITDFIQDDVKKRNAERYYLVTPYVEEFSWLVERLVEIYSPDRTEVKRLLSTIGYLLEVYSEQIDEVMEILRITASASIIYLHPDHLGKDKFKIKPLSLPPFGDDY